MALPITANTTCDIYRSGNLPPSPPDVAAVPCFFRPAYREGKESAEGAAGNTYTHVLLVAADVDIRDCYTGSGTYSLQDNVFVPANATTPQFRVMFVERVGRGTALDHKRIFLDRQGVTWPSDDV